MGFHTGAFLLELCHPCENMPEPDCGRIKDIWSGVVPPAKANLGQPIASPAPEL